MHQKSDREVLACVARTLFPHAVADEVYFAAADHIGARAAASPPLRELLAGGLAQLGEDFSRLEDEARARALGSVFPSSGAPNPTLTIVALAIRQAAHIAERMRRREL